MGEAMDLLGIIGVGIAAISLFLARRSIRNSLRSIRPRDSIAVFGPKKAGKTTLIRYLQSRPLPERHIPTFGAQPVGRIAYDLAGNETYFFRSREMFDVGGEHKNQWRVIIDRQNPNGIIYIVDMHGGDQEKIGLGDIYSIYHEMGNQKLAGRIKLRTILVLVNKCDLWGTSSQSREETLQRYRECVLRDPVRDLRSEFGDVQIQFGWSSLTHSEYAQHTNEVLRQFALSLASKE